MFEYFDELNAVLHKTEVTGVIGKKYPQSYPLTFDQGCEVLTKSANLAGDTGHKICFVGNGGSCAIASHLSVDFQKRARISAMAFDNPAMLTCLGNDFGYGDIYTQQIKYHVRSGDVVVAISSSGESKNILNAAKAAKIHGADVITFSGFHHDNKLRQLGYTNFYVPSFEYGFVELAHFAILHSIVDKIVKNV